MGWHALTLPQDPRALGAARREMLAVILSLGIDPERSVVFHQEEVGSKSSKFSHFANVTSKNPNHTELAWILNCLTPMGKLRRMTTWKVSLAVGCLRASLRISTSRGLPRHEMREMIPKSTNRFSMLDCSRTPFSKPQIFLRISKQLKIVCVYLGDTMLECFPGLHMYP